MTRAVVILDSPRNRRAHVWIDKAPHATRVEMKASKRSLPQNARMWAMLTDVASQMQWHGQRLTPDDWK